MSDGSIEINKESDANGNDFKLERYKYILQQLNSLNEHTHKNLTLFQTLITAIAGGAIIIFISWKDLKIDATIAKISLNGLIILIIVLALFVITSIVAGVFSWIDYRREEVKLLNDAVNSNFRDLPTWRNIWRWYELYVALFIVIVTTGLIIFLQYWISPLIQ